jgi:hypothetical protein
VNGSRCERSCHPDGSSAGLWSDEQPANLGASLLQAFVDLAKDSGNHRFRDSQMDHITSVNSKK